MRTFEEHQGAIVFLQATPNGTAKPVPMICQWIVSNVLDSVRLMPMKPQYLAQKKRVFGLKGMFVPGPSG